MFARRIAMLAIGWITSACVTPSVDAPGPAYDPTVLTNGRIYHWPVGATVSVHVAPAPTPGDDALPTATRLALERWMRVLGYREHRLRVVGDASSADIVVHDSRTDAPVDTGCGGVGWTHAATTTFFCPDGDTTLTLPLRSGAPGRVKVLITVQVESPDTMNGDRLLPLVLHEIGHALGIGGHSGVRSDAMHGVPEVTAPSPRDARTLRYLLHRRADVTL